MRNRPSDAGEAIERKLRGRPTDRADRVRFEKAVYVLHAFKKKAKHAVKTAKAEIDLVRRRLKAAEEDYQRRYSEEFER